LKGTLKMQEQAASCNGFIQKIQPPRARMRTFPPPFS